MHVSVVEQYRMQQYKKIYKHNVRVTSIHYNTIHYTSKY